MSKFKELIESFEEVHYPKVTRSEKGIALFRETTIEEIERLVDKYKNLTTVDQKARLLRDGIDFYLRRYHKFAIEGTIGGHYREVGVAPELCDFEHVIPQKTIRDMLLQGKLNIDQAMNPPTCLIHKENHVILKESGWDSKTPSVWHFFDRYTRTFTAEYKTYNGQDIKDPHAWTLEKHYNFFGIV